MANPNPNPNPTPNPNNADAPPSYTGHPFFDFLQSMQAGPGAGVDHRGPELAGFPWTAAFSAPGAAGECPGRRAGRGRRGGRRWTGMNHGEQACQEAQREQGTEAQNNEKDDSPDTMRDVDDPPEEYPLPHSHGFGHGRGHGHGPGHHGRRRGGPHPFWGAGPFGHHTHGPHGFHHPPPPPPPPPHAGFPFDAQAIHSFVQPFAEMARGWGEQLRRAATEGAGNARNASGNNDDGDSFEPPVDVFDTERAFVLHVAVPGAKKEDVGVNWDGDKGELSIAGVVYRPGDEAFLQTMVSSERRAGMFERAVRLPPQGREKDEVDELAISAKLEDGVLIVTVPKLEKEWTEVRKVDIE